MKTWLAALAIAALPFTSPLQAAEIRILASTNFYGELATAIAGDLASVRSVIIAPDVDPHDFEPTPSIARAVADADIVIKNGAHYDHWLEDLLESSPQAGRTVLDVSALIGLEHSDDPHVWYNPKAMPALADALTEALSTRLPDQASAFAARRDDYLATLALIDEKIAELRARFAGKPVIATEPVFGYMAAAIGLTMQNDAFQRAIMNHAEPSARDVAALEDAIRNRAVAALFYNAQVEDAFTRNIAALAESAGVPLVPVTETLPEGKTYSAWMLETLEATEKALAQDPS